jgi:hypothetical protein
MSEPIAREELAERLAVAKRRKWIVLLVALLPGVIYLTPVIISGEPFYWGVTPRGDKIICWTSIAWGVCVLISASRAVWKKAGLSCPRCGEIFWDKSYEVVVATGNCGGCGTTIVQGPRS